MTVIPLLLFQILLAIASPRASTSPSSPSEDTTLTRRRTRRYDRRGTRRRRRWCKATARPSVGSATAAPGDSTAARRARRGCRMAPPRRGQDEVARRGRQRKWPALEADFSCDGAPTLRAPPSPFSPTSSSLSTSPARLRAPAAQGGRGPRPQDTGEGRSSAAREPDGGSWRQPAGELQEQRWE